MPAHPLWVALGVPLTLVLVGAMGKKLSRGTSWLRSDFYFGPQLCLATFSADALYLGELFRSSLSDSAAKQVTALILLIVVFGLYMVLLTIHQDWEQKHHRPKRQFFWLVILSNLIGGGLFAVFVVLVKGIQ